MDHQVNFNFVPLTGVDRLRASRRTIHRAAAAAPVLRSGIFSQAPIRFLPAYTSSVRQIDSLGAVLRKCAAGLLNASRTSPSNGGKGGAGEGWKSAAINIALKKNNGVAGILASF
ncbi:hypothetical protein ACQKQA_03550 [Pseudomonas sp. NPDC089530]|uniref:hypothetical protein n=1 Tax=Pseudomonas sp. NPDC089530 TaxID=3390651 RepID=UPI003D00207F